jgi:hypothetical protein
MRECVTHYCCDCIQVERSQLGWAVDVALAQLEAAAKIPEGFARHSRADDVLLELAVSAAGVQGPKLRALWERIERWYV